MRVEDIMTRDVAYCGPETNAAEAAEIMWNRNCGALPIVANGKQLVGIVTDRDLLIALGTQDKRAGELCVSEVMSDHVSFCRPGDDVRDAVRAMGDGHCRRLPIVDERGALKGILSLDDILSHAMSKELSGEVMKTMKAICDRRNQRAAA